MTNTIKEVLEFIDENDVKFVRLGFCDPFGTQKNISIMSDQLAGAFENGISFDASSIRGFGDISKSDLLLFPDPATLTILPWRPGPGRVIRFYCDIKNPDKTPFHGDSRYLLKRIIKRCENMGYVCKIGAECEFYLFKTDENADPTFETLDKGGYFDIAPIDKGENIRREICLTLDEMGIKPESSRHERGPGQNEIDFVSGDALDCADNFLAFKSAVKSIAARNGLFASFLPKPILGKSGSGLHVNLSLTQNGFNIFKNSGEHSKIAESFIAGVLNRAAEMTLFLNPIPNSYERFGEDKAPKYVSWSHQNRSQLVRIPAAQGEKVRMELRSPDPTINPYIAFALIVSAGLDGIESSMKLSLPVDADLYRADKSVTDSLSALPSTLDKAIELAKNSTFVKDVVGDELFNRYLDEKMQEATEFAEDDADDDGSIFKEKYFNVM